MRLEGTIGGLVSFMFLLFLLINHYVFPSVEFVRGLEGGLAVRMTG